MSPTPLPAAHTSGPQEIADNSSVSCRLVLHVGSGASGSCVSMTPAWLSARQSERDRHTTEVCPSVLGVTFQSAKPPLGSVEDMTCAPSAATHIDAHAHDTLVMPELSGSTLHTVH